MARRRSFTAKSNRGKAGLVLMNNIAASYQKQKKQMHKIMKTKTALQQIKLLCSQIH